jgi:hypothetical protein
MLNDGDGVGRPIGSPTRPIKMTLMDSNSDPRINFGSKGQKSQNQMVVRFDPIPFDDAGNAAAALSRRLGHREFDDHGWMQVCVLPVSSKPFPPSYLSHRLICHILSSC